MSNVHVRICYKNGIKTEENKIFELHKLCDCDWCKHKYFGRKRCNEITAYADKESRIEELKQVLEKWTCEDRTKDVPIFYYNHIN